MNPRVAIDIEDGIARVRLDRADKRNALDLPMFAAIDDARRALQGDRSVRAVVLEATGEDFSSGLDVKAMMGDRGAMLKLLWKWLPWRANLAQRVSTGWRDLRAPVIAAIRGRCWGGGLQIALGADFRLVRPDASLSIMEGKWGLIPDMGGTLALRELARLDHAMRLAVTAEVIDGTRAVELGLATALADDPERAALDLARQVADRSPDAVAAVKKLYRKAWSTQAGGVLARESWYQARILASANQRIAVRRQRGEEIPWR